MLRNAAYITTAAGLCGSLQALSSLSSAVGLPKCMGRVRGSAAAGIMSSVSIVSHALLSTALISRAWVAVMWRCWAVATVATAAGADMHAWWELLLHA